ncbi:hypothetical protein [Streptococcus pyogenes]|nr:hypothetical protein [Streptococcus pyogenes]
MIIVAVFCHNWLEADAIFLAMMDDMKEILSIAMPFVILENMVK